MNNRLDISEVRKWYDLFKNNNELVEIRLIGNGGRTASGYFTDVDTLIRAIEPYTNEYNVYFTVNKVHEGCYGRAQKNCIVQKPKETTTDKEIIARDWVFLDLDTKRITGTNATDEQVVITKQRANEVYKFLKDNGFNEPIVTFSSNGVHLYLKCSLAPTEENNALIKRFTQAMGMLFSDDNVDVDSKVFNLGRIARLPGSYSNKGSKNDDKMPQRMCKIIKYPKEIKSNDKEYFEKIAQLFPEDARPTRENNYTVEKFDLDEFLSKHGIQVTKIESVAGGRKIILDHCPFNENHRGKDAVIFQRDTGEVAFFCFHASDADKTWRDVRLLYEPNAYDRKFSDYPRHKSYYEYPKREATPIVRDEEKGDIWLKMSQIKRPKFDLGDYIPSGVKQIDDLIIGFKRKHVTVWSGYRGCVDCDTEYFNGCEWKRIADYKEGDMVLQYNDDGTANLVYPIMYHKYPCDTLTLMRNHTNSINQCLCDEHNLVYITSKGNLFKKRFGLVREEWNKKQSVSGDIIPSFKYSGEGINYTDDEIRLALAVSAESSLVNKNTMRFRINLKHQYKKDELERLLLLVGIEYQKKKYNPRDLEFDTYLFYWRKGFKQFPKEWYGMSNSQFQIIADNIYKWDGDKQGTRGATYNTTIKENADFVQFVYSSLGIRAHIGKDIRHKNICYRLTTQNASHNIKMAGKGRVSMSEYKTKDGYKYCFSVPSGMLVLRRENAINVTGNCGKSSFLNMLILNASNLGYKSALWTGELDGDEEKRWLYLQAAGKSYNRHAQGDFYYTPDNISEKIDPWIDKYFWIFNSAYGNNFSGIIEKVTELATEHGLDVVILDNLMTLDVADLDGDRNEKQKNLMYTLTTLAKKLNIHIHIVAHPNKSGNFLRPNNISGSGHIPDLAQNVVIAHRINQDFEVNSKEFLPPRVVADILDSRCTNCLEICKCRDKGSAADHFIKLYFEIESNRLKNDIAEYIHYGWEETPTQQTFDIPQVKPNYNFYEPNNNDPFGNITDDVCPF